MSWLYALLAVCSVFTAEAWLLRSGQTEMDDFRSDRQGDIWNKYRRSLEAMSSGDKRAEKYLRQLNLNYVCTQPERVDLCQRILQNYETGELREVLRKSFFESSIRGHDLKEIVVESLLYSEGMSVPQDGALGGTALWKYMLGKLPHRFIGNVVKALHDDLNRICTPEEIQYLMTPSEDNVPSLVGEIRRNSQIFNAQRANYLREKYGLHYSPNDRFIPKGEKYSSSHQGHRSKHHKDEDLSVGMPPHIPVTRVPIRN